MTDTNRTTPAPECATPELDENVDHLCWIPDLRFALEAGIDSVPTLCGGWTEPWDPDAMPETIVRRVGGEFPLLERTDCPTCAATLSARALMFWEGKRPA